MRSNIDEAAFLQQVRDDRRLLGIHLEQAPAMLPPDTVSRGTITQYQQAVLDGDNPSRTTYLTSALERLDAWAEQSAAPAVFWVILKDIAVRAAEYEHAKRYRDRSAT